MTRIRPELPALKAASVVRQAWGPEPFRILAPGLGLVIASASLAFGIHQLLRPVSTLVAAVALGVLAANSGRVPGPCHAGIAWARTKLLRLGVILLGLRLTLGDIGRLGGRGLILVVVVVLCTFFGTQWLGRRLGLSPSLSLLVATGFSICGASAIAAMKGVTPDAREEDVVYSVALVTLCGSLAIVTLPTVGRWLGFDGATLGSWIGASVHDVAQTIATASATGSDSVKEAATVVKLTRVVMLAPMVAGVSVARRRSHGSETSAEHQHPPIVPLFVACFLAAILLRTLLTIPASVLRSTKTLETMLFACAMVGLGVGVRFDKLRRLGIRPLVLGLLSWALVATVSAIGVALLGD
jgi:uncharacterized integral membrane protein (TIGR00698 family)